jgi:hypothetical protein
MLNHVILAVAIFALTDVTWLIGFEIIEEVNAPCLQYLFFGQLWHRLPPLFSAVVFSGIVRHL